MLFFFFETGSLYVTQAGLKLTILLPQPSTCCDYRHEPPYPAVDIYIEQNALQPVSLGV
jgi:hypothetical protein